MPGRSEILELYSFAILVQNNQLFGSGKGQDVTGDSWHRSHQEGD